MGTRPNSTPLATINLWWNSVPYGGRGQSEQVYTLAECLSKVHDSICKGDGEPVIRCESGSFRLNTPRSRRGLAIMYLGTEYIRLTPLDLHYLARIFHVMQQQLSDYKLALPDLLSYVAMSLTSVVYVQQMHYASKHIEYPHLYEEHVTLVRIV